MPILWGSKEDMKQQLEEARNAIGAIVGFSLVMVALWFTFFICMCGE